MKYVGLDRGVFLYTVWRKLCHRQNWVEVNIAFVHGIPMKMGESEPGK